METDIEWQSLVAEVPRDLFIPDMVWIEDHQIGGYVAISRSDQPERWWEIVLADEPVVTQVDDGESLPGSVGCSPSSSCSKPSIVTDMLRALDLHPGHTVLEIGTGTGWNAAILSRLVGAQGHVVSVEIDPDVADMARAALRRSDFPVTVVTADGEGGYPPAAPYDRIMSTAAVCWRVPWAWIAQTRPGGVIVTPWGTSYHNGTLLRLVTVDTDTATGRFGGNLAFMRLRTQRGPAWTDEDDLDGAHASTTMMRSSEVGQAVDDFDASFAVGLRVPNCRVHVEEDAANGRHMVWLSDGQSLARVIVNVGGSSHQVHQRGPRRLWDEVESAYGWWRDAGEPEHTRFGITVTPHDQMVWLHEPTNTVPSGQAVVAT